jgi:hypothetical protein
MYYLEKINDDKLLPENKQFIKSFVEALVSQQLSWGSYLQVCLVA